MGPATYWGEYLCLPCADAANELYDEIGWPRPWWEAPPAHHVVVLCAEGMLYGSSILPLPNTIDEIGAFCEANGVTQAWIHESAFAELDLPADAGNPHPLIEGYGLWLCSSKTPVLSGYQNWWRKGGAGFLLSIPRYAQDSPFANAESGYRLLCDVAWYEHATKGAATWHGGGSITSDVAIRRIYRSRRRVDVKLTEHPRLSKDAGLMPMEAAREGRYYWSRPPAPAEADLPFCHELDLNSAYAGVASSLQLPVGEAQWHEFPEFHKAIPGLWLIGEEPWLDPNIPAPWQDNPRMNRARGPWWVTSPTMERCFDFGIEPIEAWIWPEHHAYLRPWYELVRDARAELLDVRGPALEAVKAISRRGVGRLASRTRTKKPEEDELYQPYWSWAVIAECRARIHRRISNIAQTPIAIDTDGLFFLSDLRTPEALAIELGLPYGDGLGQFKAAGTFSGAEARAAMAKSDPVGKLRKLAKGAR